MSGSGKSTLGKMLSEKFDYSFIDTDDVIVYQEGKKLQKIIDSQGDDSLQQIECNILEDLHGEDMIFSPGGSCVFCDKAMERLREISLVIFIEVPFDVLKKRFEELDANKRGIIGLKKRTFKELFDLRQPLYRKYAHATVNINHHTVEESFDLLLRTIEAHGK